MTYWNRKRQLHNTLRSIEQYKHDINIIIVDDASTDGANILCYENDHTRVITMKDKWWVNPCIPFNTGLKEADSDIILIQNAECVHNGDIVEHALNNAKDGLYITYSALSINAGLTEKVCRGEDLEEVIRPYLTQPESGWGETGWYNHPLYRPMYYHFCSAMTRRDLHDLGGFDERYARGSGFDDDDFIRRIRQKGMRTEIIEYPFVVHQYHKPFYAGDILTMMSKNNSIFHNISNKNGYDIKKYNKIFV